MNVISYDIEVIRKKGDQKPISETLVALVEANYTFNSNSRQDIEASWNDLPNTDLKAVNSSSYLLVSFSIENARVFLFKNVTKNIESKNEITITVVSISVKEIDLIVKSSFTKICSLFKKGAEVKIIDGTKINIYPFDSDKSDIVSPHFFLKADFEKDGVNLDKKDWIKLAIFILITVAFVILFFNTPSEVVVDGSQKSKPNNLKEVYSAVMGLGISFLLIEIITNIFIPHFFKSKHPKISIKTFSNILENNRKRKEEKPSKPVDPVVND